MKIRNKEAIVLLTALAVGVVGAVVCFCLVNGSYQKETRKNKEKESQTRGSFSVKRVLYCFR